MRIAPENEREGVQRQIAPKPHVLRRMDDQLRLEELTVRPSDQAVDPIGADDQVGALELLDLAHLAFEFDPDPKGLTAPLQDVEQDLSGDSRENMPTRADGGVPVVDVDRVPAGEALTDLGVGFVIGVAQGAEGLLREDHAPTEGGIRGIAFDHPHLVLGIRLLGQQGEVQSGRAAADDGVVHALSGSPRQGDRSDRCPRPSETAPADHIPHPRKRGRSRRSPQAMSGCRRRSSRRKNR